MPNGEYGDVRFGWTNFQGRGTSTNTSDVELHAAPGLTGSGAKLTLFISKISISNSNADTTPEVHLKTGANGSSTTFWTHAAPFKGGNEPVWPHPIKCNPNEALQFAVSGSVSTITVSVSGYIGLV